MRKEICVASETGCLRRVLLHRPGAEMEHLLPRQLGDMLFEDIPWAARMAEEHDAFAAALRSCGAEVLYLSDLLRDVLADNALAAAFADEVLASEVGREEEEISRLRALFLAADAETRAAYAFCRARCRAGRRGWRIIWRLNPAICSTRCPTSTSCATPRLWSAAAWCFPP